MFFILFFNFISFVLDFQSLLCTTQTLPLSSIQSSFIPSITFLAYTNTSSALPTSLAPNPLFTCFKDSVLVENPNLYLPPTSVFDRTSFPLLTFFSFAHQHMNSTFFSPFLFLKKSAPTIQNNLTCNAFAQTHKNSHSLSHHSQKQDCLR